jgi:hypothetical protein
MKSFTFVNIISYISMTFSSLAISSFIVVSIASIVSMRTFSPTKKIIFNLFLIYF